MRKRIAVVALCAVVFAAAGCGSPPIDEWRVRRAGTDAMYYIAVGAYALIEASAAAGTEPEIPAEALQQARDAHTRLQMAYPACILAIEQKDLAGYLVAMTDLGQGAGVLGQIKLKYCPVINKGDDDD